MIEFKKLSIDSYESVNIFTIFKGFIHNHPREFLLLLVLLVLEGVVASFSILAVVPFADYLIDPTLKSPSVFSRLVIDALSVIGISISFWTFGGLFFLLILVKSILTVAVRYSIIKIKYVVLKRITSNALTIFLNARWEFFSRSEQGKLLNTMYKEVGNIGDTLGYLTTFLAQFFQLIIYLTLPIFINPILTLITISLTLFFGVPLLLLNKISYKYGKMNTELGNTYIGVITEIFSSIRIIIGFGLQTKAQNKYMDKYDELISVTLRSQMLNVIVHNLFPPLAILAIIIAMAISINSGTKISELAAVMWSLLAVLPILGGMLQTRVSINSFLPSYEQLTSLLKTAEIFKDTSGDRNFNHLERNITFKEVSFTYPGRNATLINVDLELTKGEMTALVGHSGSGKSTVIDLVLGLQVPSHGVVLIDGISLNEWDINSFRGRVGYVPQDPQLFNCSIRDNLLWSFSLASDSELEEALHLSNALDFVRNLPEGINTVVGDRGISLSGGQRQRIALARAVLRKPELLILDEATSALDSESELLIQQSIEQVSRRTTILVIAHRLSTIAKANKVYVLKQGRIVEEGSFATLSMHPGGVLNAMLKVQQQLKH